MRREEIRKCIKDFFTANERTGISDDMSFELKTFLENKYQSKQYGNYYKIDVDYWAAFPREHIEGSIKRCDPIEKSKVIDCVEFRIYSDKQIEVKQEERFALTLDMDNLTKDDLIDIDCISNRYFITSGFDIYTTFMRVKPTCRGLLSSKIGDCLDMFRNDIPPFAFYNYNGYFLHSTGRVVGGIGFALDKGSILEIKNYVSSIGEHAFDKCKNLTEVYIEEGVFYIGKHAFSNTPGLIIHCNQAYKPSQWDDEWCDENCTVVWN